MRKRVFVPLACLAFLGSCRASERTPAAEAAEAADAQASPNTVEAKIQDAMSSAPAAISSAATILDWPEGEGMEPKQLRAGTNGWTCFPSSPPAVAAGRRDPMCADAASMAFLEAYLTQSTPTIDKVGFMYMLQGDAGASNTDPGATGETADNEWVVSGPHIMVVVPGANALADVPTDPAQGGPFVMWRDTPFAHVMLPVRN